MVKKAYVFVAGVVGAVRVDVQTMKKISVERELNAPRWRCSRNLASDIWIRNTSGNSASIQIDSCRIIQSLVVIVQDKDRQQKDKMKITRMGQIGRGPSRENQ